MYRPGPKRRRPRTRERFGCSDAGRRASEPRGRTIGLSTFVWAFGHIALASDAAALSNPNGNAVLGANNLCRSSLAAVGENARDASPPAVVRC